MVHEIFQRDLAGEMVSPKDDGYELIVAKILDTMELARQMNSIDIHDQKRIHEVMEMILEKPLDISTIVMPPLYIDFGSPVTIGKRCFIQQSCTFYGRGGITIGDDVFIGPKVNLITLNHDINPDNRDATYSRPIVIEDKAWIGINSTILPGVTIGYGSIVGANSLVTKDVPPMTVVGGNPAKVFKRIE